MILVKCKSHQSYFIIKYKMSCAHYRRSFRAGDAARIFHNKGGEGMVVRGPGDRHMVIFLKCILQVTSRKASSLKKKLF